LGKTRAAAVGAPLKFPLVVADDAPPEGRVLVAVAVALGVVTVLSDDEELTERVVLGVTLEVEKVEDVRVPLAVAAREVVDGPKPRFAAEPPATIPVPDVTVEVVAVEDAAPPPDALPVEVDDAVAIADRT